MADGNSHDDLIRYGKVASIDLAAGRCVVATGDIETQPIKWLELRAGRTRTWSPPTIGEQVVLLCPSGDIVGAIAVRGVTSDAYPAAGDSARELIEFGDGTVIAYDPGTHLFELLAGAGRLQIVATGGFETEGPITHKGNLTVEGTITASTDVVVAGKSLKIHTHSGVQAGAAFSGPPR